MPPEHNKQKMVEFWQVKKGKENHKKDGMQQHGGALKALKDGDKQSKQHHVRCVSNLSHVRLLTKTNQQPRNTVM